MIEYILKKDGNIQVKLDRKEVGTIICEVSAYHYHPKGNKKFAGEVFSTLKACKKSLEEDD